MEGLTKRNMKIEAAVESQRVLRFVFDGLCVITANVQALMKARLTECRHVLTGVWGKMVQRCSVQSCFSSQIHCWVTLIIMWMSYFSMPITEQYKCHHSSKFPWAAFLKVAMFSDLQRKGRLLKYFGLLIFALIGLFAFNHVQRSILNLIAKSDQRIKQVTSPPKKLTDLEKIEAIRQSCGPLCDTSRPGTSGPYFNHVTASINCRGIYQNPYIDEGHKTIPPKEIPKELWNDFTMNNRTPVFPFYFNEIYLGSKAKSPVWSKQEIDQMVLLAANDILDGNYGSSETNALRDGMDHAPGIKNGRVLVIGSEIPWVEAAVLEKGAKEVVTLEYGTIESRHPKVKTMVPSEFSESFLNGSLGLFDAVVTFSSVEHSGLGRYGDRLNPWGDIIAIARAWCVTKVNGSLTIGVMYDNEDDYIRYNAGRWYGKIRYPYLCTNWKQHYRGFGNQRVHVFTKVDQKVL